MSTLRTPQTGDPIRVRQELNGRVLKTFRYVLDEHPLLIDKEKGCFFAYDHMNEGHTLEADPETPNGWRSKKIARRDYAQEERLKAPEPLPCP